MPRRRMFLDMDCLEAARHRIRHVYDTFDTVCVQFSGGKDSTACLYLAKEIHEERGLGPVKVIFRDEEMLSPSILEYVTRVSEYDWVDMEWYCLPQGQELWVLGARQFVLLWSKEREAEGRLFRPYPPNAIKAEHFGLDPSKAIPKRIDEYTMQGKKGRTAFITGIRANESMIRYRTVTQKLHENYINRPFKLSKAIPMRFAKVIYDWTSDDVLKYITEEHGAEYCAYYDYAAMSGANQRVGIPLHSVAARRLNDVIRTEPEFYDDLVRCFPSIEAQRQLWAEFDIELVIDLYANMGWKGVKYCIDDNILTPGLHRAAMIYSNEFKKRHAKDPYGYPVDHLLRTLLLNAFFGTPSPVGPSTKAHSKRVALLQQEEQQMMDADTLDLQDDTR
jgi:predicted phosphoadenosine phosphosulfate sulfurtransferase